MGELNAPDFENQPWCIYEGPELENITIDTSVAHSLPKFSGAHGESTTTHLQRLHGICQNLKPNRVNISDFKLKTFYFSLIDSANDWFLSLPSGSIRTWVQMQKKFLDKYYPVGKAMQVRRQLQDIRQGPNETMYDYLDKFNHLERSCCTLGLPEKLIIEYLIDGLNPLDKKLLDASAGGSMMSLPLSGIRRLVTKFAENARFREETTRQDEFTRTKNVASAETLVNSMPEQIEPMKEMMMHILRKQTVQVRPCEFCGSTDHKTDACPTSIEEDPVEANAVEGYQGYNNNNNHASPSRQYGQATNPSWKNENHPPRQYNQNAPPAGQYQQREPNQYLTGQYQQKGPNQYQASSSNQQGPNKWLEDMMKELSSTVQQSSGTVQQLSSTVQQLSTTVHQNQAKNDGAIADLKKHMSQLATAMSALTNEPGRLPSQTVQNPRGNVNAMTLRSGKKLDIAPMEQEEDESPELPEENKDALEEHRPGLVPAASSIHTSEEHKERPVPRTETSKFSTALPFPVPARVPKQHVMDEDVI
ncbi:unnamed protein product [Rhodiola kirilowii]